MPSIDDLTRRPGQPDLVERVLQSLGVVHRAVDAAVIAQRAQDQGAVSRPTDADGPERREARPFVLGKVLAEAALLITSAASVSELDNRIKASIDHLAERLVRHARGIDLLVALCLEPSMALDHAIVHLHLRSLGHLDHDVDRLLAESMRARTVGVPERMPHRELEQLWLAGMWSGDPAGGAALADLVQHSCLGRPLDVLGCSEQDVYPYTHAVLYASDVGRQTIHLPRSPEEIAADAEAALAIALDADNFDLGAELLWTWPMLDLAWSPPAVFAFDLLAFQHDRHGFLPGPGFSFEHFDHLDEEARDEYRLKTSYHATLAFGILCCSILHRGGHPSIVSLRKSMPASAADDIDRLIHQSQSEAAWHEAFHASHADIRNTLAPLLLTIVLRRARDAHDFGMLRQGIQIGLEHDLVDAPAPRQAVALLRRGTLLAQLTQDRSDLDRFPGNPAKHGGFD